MATKFIFVTGGVVSSLGKGITAASIGNLLKSRGLKVYMQKRRKPRDEVSAMQAVIGRIIGEIGANHMEMSESLYFS